MSHEAQQGGAKPASMSSDEFRRAGHEMVDWIADYWDKAEEYPVLSQSKPGDVRRALPTKPPTDPEEWSAIMKDVNDIIMPGITHWQSPNFFAYFPSSPSPPSVLGELLSAGLGVQGMLWMTSPACTELETHMMDWMLDLLGLPDKFRSDSPTGGGGVIQDSASSCVIAALVAARQRIMEDPSFTRSPSELVAYTSEHAHSSMEKGLRIIGLSTSQLRKIPTDETFAMDPSKLREAIAEDLASGRRPFFVMATVGTTSSTALDPVLEIAQVCREFPQCNIWLHVDAAYAGVAAVVPEYRPWLNRGLDQVDSYCTNAHKWLLTNFDCSLFWVANRAHLLSALSINPAYLRNAESDQGAIIDYRDWQIPLGRRFRALKLWFVIRTHGAKGLEALIRSHVEMAQELAQRLEAHPSFELVAPTPLALVTFRHVGGDKENERIRDTINEGGKAFITHTRLNSQTVLRISIGVLRTEQRHVDALYDQLVQLA